MATYYHEHWSSLSYLNFWRVYFKQDELIFADFLKLVEVKVGSNASSAYCLVTSLCFRNLSKTDENFSLLSEHSGWLNIIYVGLGSFPRLKSPRVGIE